MADKPLLIIKTGSKLEALATIPGDFEDWIVQGMQWRGPVMVVNVQDGEDLPQVDAVCGAVITGSGAMVTDHEAWVEACADWLRAAQPTLPLLGICFGHQLLAYALGGEVAYNPKGVEVGRIDLQLSSAAAADPLFTTLPQTLPANASHMQSVVRLPEGAVHLAASAMEANHGFRFGAQAWGLQFHPEFSASVMPFYIDNYSEALQQQGADRDAMKRQLVATPQAASVLLGFARFMNQG